MTSEEGDSVPQRQSGTIVLSQHHRPRPRPPITLANNGLEELYTPRLIHSYRPFSDGTPQYDEQYSRTPSPQLPGKYFKLENIEPNSVMLYANSVSLMTSAATRH